MRCRAWVHGPARQPARAMPRAVEAAASTRPRARYEIDEALGAIEVTEGELQTVVVLELDAYEALARSMLRTAAAERSRCARLRSAAVGPRSNSPADLGYGGNE